MLPSTFAEASWSGVWTALFQSAAVSIVMLVIYFFKGIMAGDVKLIGMICGFLSGKDIVKFIVLIFYAAALLGIIKIIFRFIAEEFDGCKKTTIRFTAPILISYMVLYLTKGGL